MTNESVNLGVVYLSSKLYLNKEESSEHVELKRLSRGIVYREKKDRSASIRFTLHVVGYTKLSSYTLPTYCKLYDNLQTSQEDP